MEAKSNDKKKSSLYKVIKEYILFIIQAFSWKYHFEIMRQVILPDIIISTLLHTRHIWDKKIIKAWNFEISKRNIKYIGVNIFVIW